MRGKRCLGDGTPETVTHSPCPRSGHGAMRENYYLDDGTYSASQIIILMVQRALEGRGKDVAADLLAQLKEPAEAREFRLKLKARRHLNSGQSILKDFFRKKMREGICERRDEDDAGNPSVLGPLRARTDTA